MLRTLSLLLVLEIAAALTRTTPVTMRLFDHKTRGDAPPDLQTLDLSNLKRAPGSHARFVRKGRGISAGQGKSCGFGDRGQKSRSGHSVRPGFEGGQIPLYRRLPKFVGRPMGPGHSKTLYQVVKLDSLNKMADGAEVDYSALLEARAVHKSKYKISKVVLGREPLTAKNLCVKAHSFTDSARSAIESNGGKCVVLSQTTHKPLGSEEAPAPAAAAPVEEAAADESAPVEEAAAPVEEAAADE